MTQDINYQNAQSSQWVAYFTGFPDLVFKLRSFDVPSVTTGVTELGGGDFTSLSMPGDHLNYDEITLDFIIDSSWANYRRVLGWMKFNARNPAPFLTDLTVHLLDNQGQFQNIAFNYQECMPVMIGRVTLDSNNDETDLSVQVSIRCNDIIAVDDQGQPDDFKFVSS